MRLLERNNAGEFSLTKYFLDQDEIPPYAILSHTWVADEEVVLEELKNGTGKSKPGFHKIKFCGDKAKRDGLRHFWVDTCCIDKSNNNELSEAINSMFRWYHEATKCYAYLQDVSYSAVDANNAGYQRTWESDFRKSRWFTRGWTLQELLAPRSVEFFSREGQRLGDKTSLEQQIYEITGIALPALRGSPLSQFPVDKRMTWAEGRRTTRKEDKAYSLLGIFGVFMPLIYGEGQDHAIKRLKKEISSRWEEEGRIDAARAHFKNSKNVPDAASQRTDVLQWLSSEPYLQHHEQMKQDILLGTGTWLLKDPVFQKWKCDSISSVLWLHGIPGSGKSKLVSIFIEHAIQEFVAEQSPGLAFFYCSRNTAEPTRSDPKLIMASLARQLSYDGPHQPLLQPAVQIYEEKEAQAFASGPLMITESRDLIVRLTQHYPQTILIIDALDECSHEKRFELLDAFQTILQFSRNVVKIFISSRNDQDIVFHLKHHPNLEINSMRNSADIAHFVSSETQRLIQSGQLLRSSTSCEEMRGLIIRQVIEGASGMFRWASLQLQNLTSFKLDADIRNRLGKLPSTLEGLYADHYEILSTTLDEFGKAIVMNVLSWLLCAQRAMKTKEFLAAISITPGVGHEPVSREQVLDICNNLVIFDAQLDTFRFAHLSVREFLEKQAAFSITFTNTLVAEICIFHLLSSHPFSLHNKDSHIRQYSNVYWATHSQLSASAKSPARLGKALQDLLLCDAVADSALSTWLSEVQNLDMDFSIGRKLQTKLKDCRAGSASALFVAASFDLSEITETLYRSNKHWPRLKNESNKCLLEVCAYHGSCNIMSLLFDLHEESAKVTEEVVKAAAGNSGDGEKVVALLLKERGIEIQITEGVVKAAAGNYGSGKKVIALLLEQQAQSTIDPTKVVTKLARLFDEKCVALLLKERGKEIQITEEVVKAAAGNSGSGEKVMALLLKDRGIEIQITEGVVKAAAGNYGSGKKVMALLLEQQAQSTIDPTKVVTELARLFDEKCVALLLKERGKEIQITEEVVKAAAGNSGSGEKVVALLLKERGKEIQITEGVVKAAAGNYGSGKKVMALLLKERGKEIQITEGVVKAAAGNSGSGEKVMVLLFEERGIEIQITEGVVKAAAGNSGSGERVMALLLKERGKEIQITEEVVKAAAGNSGSGEKVMVLLFEERGIEIQITEGVVKAAAGNSGSGERVMALLLKERGKEIQITEEVVKAAAGNSNSGEKVMALLLKERGIEIQITEGVVKAAAGNSGSGEKVMVLLFEERGEDVKITEEVLSAARGEAMLLVLKHLGGRIMRNRSGAELMVFSSRVSSPIPLVLFEG